MNTRYPVLPALVVGLLTLLAASAPAAGAQTGRAFPSYRNALNARFGTIASGPMHAMIVDVPQGSDSAAITSAVARQVNSARRARANMVQRELAFLQRQGILKQGLTPGIPDIVMVREGGSLMLPVTRDATRGRGPNDLTFVLPTTGAGAWTSAQRQELLQLINIVYPELKNVYGDPSWTGTVTILDGDNMTPILPDRPALTGGIYNVSQNQIIFAQYQHPQTRVLNLTEMMALAFHGPAAISYDAWEIGMARAATIITVRNVLPVIQPLYQETITVADPLYHKVDLYDLLNQPPLGNDRFYPVSQQNTSVNQSSLAGMLVPRLEMSGSAWLKVAAENPSFFRTFNSSYYTALGSNPNLRNNVPALKNLVAAVVPTVEGLAFGDWYQRQYVLDTSVSVGNKLYAWAFPDRPDAGADDYAMAIVLVYYRTVINTDGTSDETNLSGICYPIYWDYTFQNRLFLSPQYERVDILDGLGTVAPTFFNTIGGDTSLNGMMRITMDFPVNLERVRLYTAPRSMGTNTSINNFWGAVVGADTGSIRIQMENGADATFPVAQGAFGGFVKLGASDNAFNGIGRATVTFTASGGQTTVRRINTGYGEQATVLYASDPVGTLTHTFVAGPQMVSFPVRPLKPKAADALLDPTTHQPIFNDSNLLMARWRQDVAGDDKYVKYPLMDLLTPGYGYWMNLPGQQAVEITGQTTAQESDITASLTHGWNQIGTPYEQAIDINNLQFQYQADNVPVDLQTAVSNGWVMMQTIQQTGQPPVDVIVWQYDPANGYTQASTLEPWKGYWIRVLVSDGLNITYPNPSRAARASQTTRTTRSLPGTGWSLPLTVRSSAGLGSTAIIGQSDGATPGYDARFDALKPPDFTRAAPSMAFQHTDWGANSGDYYSEIHRTSSRDAWNLTVATPIPNQSYTLSWAGLAGVPRSVRLVLVDMATGRRTYLQGSSGYTFSPGTAATRSFQIVPEIRAGNALRILNLRSVQNRAAGGNAVQIAFDLTSGAEVTAEIRGADGRVIRRLGSGRAAPAGTNQILWDTKTDQGISVPAGAYVVQVTARTPEGESARVIQPVLVLR